MYTSALKAKPISWKTRWKNIDHVTAKGRVRTQKIYELSSLISSQIGKYICRERFMEAVYDNYSNGNE